jgi:hypothetical protein
MNTHPSRLLHMAMALWALLALAACQTEDPAEAQTLLRIKLNDSLSRYERVLVEVYARADSNKVVDTLWNDKLPSPKDQIRAYDVKKLQGSEFFVQVTGFAAGSRLALQTRIYYSPVNGTFVRHDAVPPLVPQNWLTSLKPSVGTLSPDFLKDSLFYLVKLPQDIDTIFFSPVVPNPSVIVQANGQIVPYGKPTKTYKIGGSPDTVRFSITDTSTGVNATREYQIAMIPTPPLGLLLASLVPSAGRLGTEFTPENTIYNLYMPSNIDTVSFVASPLDPQKMTMTIDNVNVGPGQKSPIITVARGTIYTLEIYVMQPGKKGYYVIKLDHTQTSSH